ncbi:uncharacterized protein LOC9641381 [Selaginella moellendorffii]|nr:uncharacterized protein LOC9641381 [Selaginella moellendorffii]|eukprot:XP_002973314.2 uncharacterized protein LOC9641381 [Selaginella moellendorffii]
MAVVAMACSQALSFGSTIQPQRRTGAGLCVSKTRRPRRICSAVMNKEKETKQSVETDAVNKDDGVEEVTRKFGLEAGLWKIFSSKKNESGEKKVQAKELLARYGGAYLVTSISLSAVSFALCYLLINAGVDVPSLLAKVGIQSNETGEKVGTLALAYAAHKAASPIRFPPTVALTPIVASWFGKKNKQEGGGKS